MDKYLHDNLPLVNKYSYIKLVLGKKKSENIFNSNKSLVDIKKILENITSLDYKVHFKNYNCHIYNKCNEKIVIDDDGLSYYIVTNHNTTFLENILLTTENIEKDKYIIPSLDKSEKGEIYEIMEFNISQIFQIFIKKKNENYNVEIKLSRPNNLKTVLLLLEKIFAL